MGWFRQRRMWQTAVVLLASAFAAAELLAKQWLPASLAAGVATATGAVLQRLESRATASADRHEALDHARIEQFLALRGNRFQTVRNVTEQQAGVAETAQLSSHWGHDRMPPYVSRDLDTQLRRCLREHRFLLIVGASKSGKTRAAFEAVSEEFPRHRFLWPASAGAMTSLQALARQARPCVVWFDDLHHYLRPGGLTRQVLDALIALDGVVVVATLRAELLETIHPLDDPGEHASELWREVRRVLSAAVQVDLSAYWSPAERARARLTKDPRLQSAIRARDHRVALALVAGHEQVQRWTAARSSTRHVRAAAIVSAAVDAQRLGLYRPLPNHLLEQAHAAYLPQREEGIQGGYETWDDALDWAQLFVETAGRMLIPHDGDTVRAVDYLVEALPVEPVPDEAWRIWLDEATPEESFVLGQSAAARLEYERAREALRKAESAGVDGASAALAVIAAEEGRPARAVPVLSERARALSERYGDHDNRALRAQYELAHYTGEAGDAAQAAALFAALLPRCLQALAADDDLTLDVRHQLATFTGEAGNAATAVVWFTELVSDLKAMRGTHDQRTLSARHQEAKFIGVQPSRKNKELAAQLYQKLADDCAAAFGPNHPETLTNRHQYAAHTAAAGHTTTAAQLFNDLLPTYVTVFGADHPATLWTRLQCALYPLAPAPPATVRLQQVLADFVRIRGRDDPATLQVEYELALAHIQEGTPAGDIAAHLQDIQSRQQAILNPGHPALARTQAALARVQPQPDH